MSALAKRAEIMKKYYTYADYLEWDEDFRCELIHGEIRMMAAPTSSHQTILVNLSSDLRSFLRGKTCQVFPAAFDVRLNADERDDIVVQPDIVVICDPSKITERGCVGAPDLVIEILSPSTGRHDRITKMQLYKDAGVREYWIIDPTNRTVDVYVLETGDNFTWLYNDTGITPVHVLEGCEISMDSLFDKVPNYESLSAISP